MTNLELTNAKQLWKEHLQQTKANTERALRILELIEQLERKMNGHLEDSRSWLLHFPDLRAKAIHKADVCKRGIIWLSDIYNNLTPELQL